MVSSAVADSGRVSGGRSNFSQTCSLLSQYLKEKGNFGDLTLALTRTSDLKGTGDPTETKNLLPMIGRSGQKSGCSKSDDPAATFSSPELSAKFPVETAPLIIFYAGQVMVFDDFPFDKAREIMLLASRSSAAHNHGSSSFVIPETPAEVAAGIPIIVPNFAVQSPLVSDLPIARKNSLARFLEKRKARITANAPYPASKTAAAAPSDARGWLGWANELRQ